jgi:ribulose-phosphate 3-epimerase
VCHIESDTDFHEFFSYGHELGMELGLAINPETDIEKLAKYSDILDYILIMAVNPGQQGQEFLAETYERIAQISERYPGKAMYIDGGVKADHIAQLIEAGVTGVAMGSAIFGEPDPVSTLHNLLAT